MNWKLKDGAIVKDRYNSHLHSNVLNVLTEAMGKIIAAGREFIVEAVNFDRVIGDTSCVVTNSDDEIVFAQRPKRSGLTRFVKNRQPEPCTTAVVILKLVEKNPNVYILITAFIGETSEPEPWDKNATEKSFDFWNSHALVWREEEIISGTEINICPW